MPCGSKPKGFYKDKDKTTHPVFDSKPHVPTLSKGAATLTTSKRNSKKLRNKPSVVPASNHAWKGIRILDDRPIERDGKRIGFEITYDFMSGMFIMEEYHSEQVRGHWETTGTKRFQANSIEQLVNNFNKSHNAKIRIGDKDLKEQTQYAIDDGNKTLKKYPRWKRDIDRSGRTTLIGSSKTNHTKAWKPRTSKRLTLSEIKSKTKGHFWDKDTMKFFKGYTYKTRYDSETKINYVVATRPNGTEQWYRFDEAKGELIADDKIQYEEWV